MNDIIEFSESKAAIAKALVAAQKNIGTIKKSSKNPHFNSKYADLASVVEAVSPALHEADLVLLQGSANQEDGSIRVQTMLLHGSSAEWVRTSLNLRPFKPDAQGVGSTITYGRRYTLQSLLGLAAEDDDGNAASGRNYESRGDEEREALRQSRNYTIKAKVDPNQSIKEEVEERLANIKSRIEGKVKGPDPEDELPEDGESEEVSTPERWWVEYKVKGVKGFIGMTIGSISTTEMARIDSIWVAKAHAAIQDRESILEAMKTATTAEEMAELQGKAKALTLSPDQASDLKAFEARLAYDKVSRPF
jgi:hypothetical protein